MSCNINAPRMQKGMSGGAVASARRTSRLTVSGEQGSGEGALKGRLFTVHFSSPSIL